MIQKITPENVTSRKGRVSRNPLGGVLSASSHAVTSRKGRVSRNRTMLSSEFYKGVTSRKGRVSRNWNDGCHFLHFLVTSRKGRVSRNADYNKAMFQIEPSRPARGV